jgi:amidase
MRCILQYDSWRLDEEVLSVPWLEIRKTQTLMSKIKTFGVVLEDTKYPLHPAVLRTLRVALQKISAAGHQLVPLSNELPTNIIATTALTAMTILNMDPEKTPIGYVARGGEPLVPSISALAMPELANMKPNINGVFNLNTDIGNIRAMFRLVIVENNLDAILMPAYQATAVPHDSIRVPAYAVLANLLDVSGASEQIEIESNNHSILLASYHLARLKKRSMILLFGTFRTVQNVSCVHVIPLMRVHRANLSTVSSDAVEGAPCAIQIMGRNMKDEELLVNAQVVEKILKS